MIFKFVATSLCKNSIYQLKIGLLGMTCQFINLTFELYTGEWSQLSIHFTLFIMQDIKHQDFFKSAGLDEKDLK